MRSASHPARVLGRPAGRAAGVYAQPVPTLDNPAGRLHALLTSYRLEAGGDTAAVHDVWKAVLNVNDENLPLALCEVAALIPAIEGEVEKANQSELATALSQYRRAWSLPILSSDIHPRQSPGPGADYVDQSALAALGVVSVLLSATASEVRLPDPGDLDALRQQFDSALGEVLKADDLPPSLRAVMIARLHDMTWALDHINVAGPDGVSAAIERLVGAIALLQPDENVASSPSFTHFFKVVRFAWEMFRKGPEVAKAVEGWSSIVPSLPPGS